MCNKQIKVKKKRNENEPKTTNCKILESVLMFVDIILSFVFCFVFLCLFVVFSLFFFFIVLLLHAIQHSKGSFGSVLNKSFYHDTIANIEHLKIFHKNVAALCLSTLFHGRKKKEIIISLYSSCVIILLHIYYWLELYLIIYQTLDDPSIKLFSKLRAENFILQI